MTAAPTILAFLVQALHQTSLGVVVIMILPLMLIGGMEARQRASFVKGLVAQGSLASSSDPRLGSVWGQILPHHDSWHGCLQAATAFLSV